MKLISHAITDLMYHLANNFHILDAVIYIYHTAQTSNDPKEGGFENTAGKRRKCWEPSFFSFSHSVFYSFKERNCYFINVYNLQMLSTWPCHLLKGYLFTTNLIEVHTEMLTTKYQSSTPSSLRKEEF